VKYLNNDDVKKAIHVDDSITWTECSDTLNYNFSYISTAPLYQYLIDGGYCLDILVYSGDDDSVCATVGTQEWVSDSSALQLFLSDRTTSSFRFGTMAMQFLGKRGSHTQWQVKLLDI
jgi:hypothetical protein